MTDSIEDRQLYEQSKAAYRNTYAKHIVIGGTVMLVGLSVTIVSYLFAEDSGFVVLAYGAIAGGAADLLYGLFIRRPR